MPHPGPRPNCPALDRLQEWHCPSGPNQGQGILCGLPPVAQIRPGHEVPVERRVGPTGGRTGGEAKKPVQNPERRANGQVQAQNAVFLHARGVQVVGPDAMVRYRQARGPLGQGQVALRNIGQKAAEPMAQMGGWVPACRRGELRPTKTGTPTRPAKRQSTWHEGWRAWRPRPLIDSADRPHRVTKQTIPPSDHDRGQPRSIAPPRLRAPTRPDRKRPRADFPQSRRGRPRYTCLNLWIATRGHVSTPPVASARSKAVRCVRMPRQGTPGTRRCPHARSDTACLPGSDAECPAR